MEIDMINRGFFIVAPLLCFGMLGGTAHADMLISNQEAALPAASSTALAFRGVTRGPKVEVVSPATTGGTVTSPIDLKMKFQSFGGATVDPTSVKVTYLKNPAVDLTPRMKKYIEAGGLDMATAEMPAGEHPIRVEIKDSEGRAGAVTFTLKITK